MRLSLHWLLAVLVMTGMDVLAAPAAASQDNCYARLTGVTPGRGRRVECVDGDPTCDNDGACNGSCDFLVRMCLNQCVSPIAISRLRVRGATLELPTLPSTEAGCGGYSIVTAPVRGGGRRRRRVRPGATLAFAAMASDGFKLTRDKISFVCKPRTDACPPVPEAKYDMTADMAVLSVDPPTPTGGGPVTVRVDFPTATDITLTASGEACGGFTTHGPAPNPLVVTQPVGDFGGCNLTAQVNAPDGPRTFQARFQVMPTQLILPQLTMPGGLFLPGALPAQTGSPSDPLIASFDAPNSLVNGGSAQIRLHLTDPSRGADVNGVQVQVMGAGGYVGYYEAPAVLDGDAVVVAMTLDNVFSGAGPVDVLAQLVDRFGNIGNQVSHSFGVVQVGAGVVQVSLSWNTPTDVDLHVREASGTDIYWGHRTSSSGGVLDLDSNAACSIDGVNNENVTWPTTPPSGNYQVRVDFWSDCGGLAADYTATVRACGEVQTVSGHFAPGTADHGGQGAGVQVATFSTDCRSRVRGTALYEDFAPTLTGLATSSTLLPIRLARVLVKRAADDTTLAEGVTEQDGTFDVRFSNSRAAGYYVVVMAARDDAILHQLVQDDRGNTYQARSGVIDETVEPDKTGLAVEAPASGAGPAFNIFDQGVQAALLVKAVNGVVPPPLTWLWTRGKKGVCVGNMSCYVRDTKTISVLSIPADPDEYDDLVLLHQYGHFYQDVFSRSDSPGGPHTPLVQVDPRLAWAEGSATFFGQTVKGSAVYLDTTPAGIRARLDVESPEVALPLGTSDGTETGNLSETVVGAVLWDLADTTNEPMDTLAQRDAVFAALRYLGGPAFLDRGVAGADLVDLLDGWFCLGLGNRGDANSGVQGNVVGLHRFNYDFAAVASCH